MVEEETQVLQVILRPPQVGCGVVFLLQTQVEASRSCNFSLSGLFGFLR